MSALFKKTKTPLPAVNKKVGSLVMNDKLVIIVGASREEIELQVRQFCKLYHRSDYSIQVRLHPIEDRILALTFPEDLDFVVFFYMIKSLSASCVDTSANVLGWCTLPPVDVCNPISAQAMLYVHNDAKLGRSVFVTTQENACWVVNFDKKRYESVPLVQHYTRPPYSFLEVKHREGYIIS
ncbi:hypothetical protein M2459_003042 [Parabacteroides sp. PF5-5]|uniref:hypothetical protein n=1 Tax=unclassified Parabacteroides TaxID=2649774 RepID=UPI002474DAFA|nr:MULTISPECIES: hypothetical protein [unclassified Parabacteroides]MDH6305831.1 hypothetical protein [Parabacteroides sp. PH5-39]MDH6317355.1 hypothetical protein [Parabacteroides sp. PF5-13]MDH6320563.1 hypothetical protein [Parabacteroides sp. PH5-13]MDH6324274.1 hypothetical protein [Parabacteroides sp. PH5-8]MDH6328471.1 hypothetical protein [Parabacteroides sp. PH5-41]